MLERADRDLLKEAVRGITRLADVNEKILELSMAQEEPSVEPGPPICPHCGATDPDVTQLNVGESGPLGGFVMQAETHCCNRTVYAVPMFMAIVQNTDQVHELLRGGGNNGNS